MLGASANTVLEIKGVGGGKETDQIIPVANNCTVLCVVSMSSLITARYRSPKIVPASGSMIISLRPLASDHGPRKKQAIKDGTLLAIS